VSELAEFALRAVVIGVGATVVMDLWAVLLQRLFRVQPSNWAMVGRWVGHFPSRRFLHDKIAEAPPIRSELALGWIVHYLTGITTARYYSVSGASTGRGGPRCYRL
jgi:hypothetical protein